MSSPDLTMAHAPPLPAPGETYPHNNLKHPKVPIISDSNLNESEWERHGFEKAPEKGIGRGGGPHPTRSEEIEWARQVIADANMQEYKLPKSTDKFNDRDMDISNPNPLSMQREKIRNINTNPTLSYHLTFQWVFTTQKQVTMKTETPQVTTPPS